MGDVYSYLVKDEKVVLVDCGQHEEDAFQKVKSVLAKQGLHISDIDEIWLTHGHPDHFGQAARLAERSGARVRGHPKGRANFACNNDRDLFAEFFSKHAIPKTAIQKMVEQLDWLQQYQQPITPEWVSEGDILSSGTLQFEARHTPGHAAGHLTFTDSNGLIFGGDLLLKHITTNALINFDPDTGERNKSLLQYREALQWLRSREGLLLPGHGKFISEIQEVVEHHLAEHEKRNNEVKKLLKEESRTLLELAFRMFPKPMNRGDVFLVLSEVMGYLDWGIMEEEIEEINLDGKIAYHRI